MTIKMTTARMPKGKTNLTETDFQKMKTEIADVAEGTRLAAHFRRETTGVFQRKIKRLGL